MDIEEKKQLEEKIVECENEIADLEDMEVEDLGYVEERVVGYAIDVLKDDLWDLEKRLQELKINERRKRRGGF